MNKLAVDIAQIALESLAKSPAIDLTKAGSERIKNEVVREVSAVIVNQANQEPWYQSRVTWGALVSIAMPLLGIVGVTTDVVDPDELVALGLAAGTIFGGVLTIYGRYIAKKPLGV